MAGRGDRPGAALLLALSPVAAPAQELVIPPVRYPALPATAAYAEGFAPRGWRVERRAEGDLNGDGAADLAFVLRAQDPANILANDGLGENPFDTNPRILAVAFSLPEGGYRLAVQNHVLIPRPDNPGQADPFGEDSEGIGVAGGALRVSLYLFMNAGGWDAGPTSFTLRWQAGALRLIGYDFVNVQRNSGEMTGISINYLTGRIRTVRGDNASAAERICWTRVSTRALLTIDQLGGGFDFDPEGAIGGIPMGSGRYCPGRR